MRAVVVDRWMEPSELSVREVPEALEALGSRKTQGRVIVAP